MQASKQEVPVLVPERPTDANGTVAPHLLALGVYVLSRKRRGELDMKLLDGGVLPDQLADLRAYCHSQVPECDDREARAQRMFTSLVIGPLDELRDAIADLAKFRALQPKPKPKPDRKLAPGEIDRMRQAKKRGMPEGLDGPEADAWRERDLEDFVRAMGRDGVSRPEAVRLYNETVTPAEAATGDETQA